jgi:murein DD-endopeptidase MepM/ murein hydrolase activator NlpD
MGKRATTNDRMQRSNGSAAAASVWRAGRVLVAAITAATLALVTSQPHQVGAEAAASVRTAAAVRLPNPLAAFWATLGVLGARLGGAEVRLGSIGHATQRLRALSNGARMLVEKDAHVLRNRIEATLPSSAMSDRRSRQGGVGWQIDDAFEELRTSLSATEARAAAMGDRLGTVEAGLESLRIDVERQIRSALELISALRAHAHKAPSPQGTAGLVAEARSVLARLTRVRRDLRALGVDVVRLADGLRRQNRETADRLRSVKAREATAFGLPFEAIPGPKEPAWGTFLVCPVDEPRTVANDFGAPRYGGGFHVHQGNDILAPMGTPVRAPFTGTAEAGSSVQGGLAVKMFGATGYVYNAHLATYGKLGAVEAGDIIGYVGTTGNAIGGPPHDHFEWHPANGPAVDPHPLLIEICQPAGD